MTATTEKGASHLSGESASHLRRLGGAPGALASVLCVTLSAYALYWVLFIVQPQVYRVSFLLIALVLTFLLFPFRKRRASRVSTMDWILVAATVVSLG